DNTEAVPVECTVLSDGIWLEGDDVKCNDEDKLIKAGLDEKLSVDSVVMVTKLGLPLGIVVKETACEKVLLTDVGEGSADVRVTCDDRMTGSVVLRTDENEDEILVVESDCCIEDESVGGVAILLVSTDENSDAVEDDIGCEVLVLVLTWCDVSGTEDSNLVV
ncbi:hypothetical protein ACROYT_G031294, partial [Oculina patagonica]